MRSELLTLTVLPGEEGGGVITSFAGSRATSVVTWSASVRMYSPSLAVRR